MVKYNSLGSVEWATNIGGISSVRGWGISINSSNEIYTAGRFTNSTFINNYEYVSSGIISTSPFGLLYSYGNTQDIYLAKYNKYGKAIWATNIGGISTDDTGGIDTDSNGNVILGGYFGTSVLVNSYETVTAGIVSTTNFGLMSATGGIGADAIVVKYNTEGKALWATNIGQVGGSTAQDRIWDITTDKNDNIYATGSISSNGSINSYVQVSSGIISTSLFGKLTTNYSTIDSVIVKYNPLGIVQWATNLGGSGTDSGYAIDTDSIGNVYVAGNYSLSTIVNSYDRVSSDTIQTKLYGNLSSLGFIDAYLAKYNPYGHVQWVTNIGGSSGTSIWGLTVDQNDKIYCAGAYRSSIIVNETSSVINNDILTQPVAILPLVNVGANRTGFIVGYNTSGKIVLS